MGAAASHSEMADVTVQRLEVIQVGKRCSGVNRSRLQFWLENRAFRD
jgi:hypothetical protein